MTQRFLPWWLSSFDLQVESEFIVCYSHCLFYRIRLFCYRSRVSLEFDGFGRSKVAPSEGTERHPVEPREVTVVREGVRVSAASRLSYKCSSECVYVLPETGFSNRKR